MAHIKIVVLCDQKESKLQKGTWCGRPCKGTNPMTAPATVDSKDCLNMPLVSRYRHYREGQTNRSSCKSGDLPRRLYAGIIPEFRATTEGASLMTTQATTLSGISVKDRILVGTAALAFGLLITFTTGFAASSTLHNAAHDTRHSVGFPCH